MKKKILVIDDDPVIVTYLEKLFNDNGYETCAAHDGIEAAEVAKQEKPDLITLDLQMPAEWGPRFYRKLIKNKEFKDIPVIVVSGIDGDHAIKNAAAFIRKPFNPDELLKIVKNAIG
ncbi:MAG: response regulator [Deltaproteobacteria bacterium]|nr:response regulator [Deltaproteobacteria bacterium]